MSIFTSTLNQTAFLFGFIIIGYVLAKYKALPENTGSVLSKLENTVFIPVLVMGTFVENFTIERISTAWELLTISLLIAIIVIPIVREYLLSLKKKQEENRKLFGNCYQESDYICVQTDGSRITPHSASRRFSNFLKNNGFPHIRPE